jgi:DnaJ family protein C protein 2
MIFSCIQKAYEQLGDTEEKRRAFDSIDPSFDDTVPDSVQDKNFFSSLGPIFEHNSR